MLILGYGAISGAGLGSTYGLRALQSNPVAIATVEKKFAPMARGLGLFGALAMAGWVTQLELQDYGVLLRCRYNGSWDLQRLVRGRTTELLASRRCDGGGACEFSFRGDGDGEKIPKDTSESMQLVPYERLTQSLGVSDNPKLAALLLSESKARSSHCQKNPRSEEKFISSEIKDLNGEVKRSKIVK